MCGRFDFLAENSVSFVKFIEAALGQCQDRKLEAANCKSVELWKLDRAMTILSLSSLVVRHS